MFAVLITTGCSYHDGITEKQHVIGLENEAEVESEYFDNYSSGSTSTDEFEDWEVRLFKSEKPFNVILSIVDEEGEDEIRMEAEEMENLGSLLG